MKRKEEKVRRESHRIREKKKTKDQIKEVRESQKKEDAGAQKGRQNIMFFPMICGSGGSKSKLVKVTGAAPSGQMRDEQLHATVARSTFPSQNVQKTQYNVGPLF